MESNKIDYLNGLLKGYYLGKKNVNLNVQSIIEKINELKSLEKTDNNSSEKSSINTENNSTINTDDKMSENNVEDVSDLNTLEINVDNIKKIDEEVINKNKLLKQIQNRFNILRTKSKTLKINNVNKLNEIYTNYQSLITKYTNRLLQINNFYKSNNIREKKDIWNLIEHSKKIIKFIIDYNISYNNDPLVFKSIILTMYKKNFNMIDLQGKFLNIKSIIDLHFSLEEDDTLDNYEFYFEQENGKKILKSNKKILQENITTNIIKKKNLESNKLNEEINISNEISEEVEEVEEEVTDDEEVEEIEEEVTDEEEVDEVEEGVFDNEEYEIVEEEYEDDDSEYTYEEVTEEEEVTDEEIEEDVQNNSVDLLFNSSGEKVYEKNNSLIDDLLNKK